LHLREVKLVGLSRQQAVFPGLQQDESVSELVGSGRQVTGGPGDVIAVDLGACEIPPAPTFSKGIGRVPN